VSAEFGGNKLAENIVRDKSFDQDSQEKQGIMKLMGFRPNADGGLLQDL